MQIPEIRVCCEGIIRLHQINWLSVTFFFGDEVMMMMMMMMMMTKMMVTIVLVKERCLNLSNVVIIL